MFKDKTNWIFFFFILLSFDCFSSSNIMENFKNQFEIELDPFKNYVNVTIEAMEENWRLVAQKVIGETDETRQIGIQTLKVQYIKVK